MISWHPSPISLTRINMSLDFEMNITAKNYAAHRELSECSAVFLDFVKENPACLEEASFKGVVSTYFGYVKFHPWPTFINKKTREMTDEAAVKVYRLITIGTRGPVRQ